MSPWKSTNMSFSRLARVQRLFAAGEVGLPEEWAASTAALSGISLQGTTTAERDEAKQ